MLLYQILESVVPRGKVERLYKNNKFKASVPSWKDLNLNYLMDHILHQILKINLSILLIIMKQCLRIFQIIIHVNNTQNRITFRIQTEYYLETMKLLRIPKIKDLKQFYWSTFIHCIIVNNDHQHDSIALHIFILSKSFISLLDTSPKMFHISETFNSDFSLNELLFTNQNSKPQKIVDKINITFAVNW